MKAHQVLTLAGISMLAMSSSCEKEGDASPAADGTTGILLGAETTVDNQFQNPRARWTVNIAPLSFPGWGGQSYQQAKVFNLPDTTTYKAGCTITFHYRLVPQTQETPWRTRGAWMSLAAARTGTDALPEIILSDIKIIQSR
ncbi:hypothetical protein [Hymenobacter sp. PAMC 26628]|uniref:hypothetical protein n=1 Tax=Hymenobacter sp. PAMC 26628 TaxID=1484118 RepID=UPI0012FFD13E|nr:hypothetical protein [Hymenobacter sp. PAMC 26628]